MSKSVLYYPSIEIPNTYWLRNVLLYWDEICSIVPYKGYVSFEQNSATELMKEFNSYREIYPEDIFKKGSELFLETLERRLYMYRTMSRKNTIFTSANRTDYLFNEKIPFHYFGKKMIEYCREAYPQIGRLLSNYSKQDMGISMDVNLLNIYMRTLAEFATGADENIVVATDKSTEWEKLCAEPYGEKFCALDVVLDSLPMPDPKVKLEQILEFKRDNGGVLIGLQNKITRFESEIKTCSDERELRYYTEKFVEKWRNETEEKTRILNDNAIKVIKGIAVVGLAVATIASRFYQLSSHLQTALTVSDSLCDVGGVLYPCVRKCGPYKEKGDKYLVSAKRSAILEHMKCRS